MDMIIEEILFSVLLVSDHDCFDGMVDGPFLKHQIIPLMIGDRQKIAKTTVLKTSNVEILRKFSGRRIDTGGILNESMMYTER